MTTSFIPYASTPTPTVITYTPHPPNIDQHWKSARDVLLHLYFSTAERKRLLDDIHNSKPNKFHYLVTHPLLIENLFIRQTDSDQEIVTTIQKQLDN